MLNFTYHNPTNIVFGKGQIAQLETLISKDSKILMTFGGGSIRKNGVYEQVRGALTDHTVIEFQGIEPNPRYETLMKAVELGRNEDIDFLLAVGGGSVLDGTKFIAAAYYYRDGDPWEICSRGIALQKALPIGSVLTLPATGSESNGAAVISRESTKEKLAFIDPLVFPVFAILDPETTFSLPVRQVINGIVDAYAHVLEQYMTYDVNSPLQDRQAEAILLTLIEEGPKVLKNPHDYDLRANIMWCATQALNGLIACGVVQDWSTHMIGHELTALYGIDHALSLAVVFPAVLRHQRVKKERKLLQYADRIWGIREGSPEERVYKAIDKTIEFFRSLGVGTTLAEYDIPKDGGEKVAARLSSRGAVLGENQNIGKSEVVEILSICA